MKFVWEKEIDSLGDTQYRCTVYNHDNECVYQTVVYKGYNSLYKRVMYNYLSNYTTTLKEIKEYTENNIIEYLTKHDII